MTHGIFSYTLPYFMYSVNKSQTMTITNILWVNFMFGFTPSKAYSTSLLYTPITALNEHNIWVFNYKSYYYCFSSYIVNQVNPIISCIFVAGRIHITSHLQCETLVLLF